MANLKRKGNGKKRSRKTVPISEYASKEIGTDVIVTGDEELVAVGKGNRATIASTGAVSKGSLFPILCDEKSIVNWMFVGNPKSKKLYENNPEDFITDVYLASLMILPKKYVSDKWGFSYGKDKNTDGKSRLNDVLKRAFTRSGGRVDYYTPKLQGKGIQHYDLKENTKKYENLFAEDIDREQLELVKKLPNNSIERKIMQPSVWLNDFVMDVKHKESEFEYVGSDGELKVARKLVKKELYKLADYAKYKDHRDKVIEVADNYKTDFSKPFDLMK